MARNLEQELAVNFVLNRMSEYHNGCSLDLPEKPDRRGTVMQNKALEDRRAAGMVDNIFRDQNGEPLLARLPDGTVVPNGAACDEASLAKAREALMAPRNWPVAK